MSRPARVVVPDCAHIGRDDWLLLPADARRELVRRIAEEGPGAIDRYLEERRAAGDKRIVKLIERLRERLLAQAEARRKALEARYGDEAAQLEADYRARLAELQNEEAATRARADHLSRMDPEAIAAALRADGTLGFILDHDLRTRIPWWRRLGRWLVRALRFLLSPVLWLLRSMTPEGSLGSRDKSVAYAALDAQAGGLPLDMAGDLYLGSPAFRKSVRARLRAAPARERLRRAWERLLGRQDYAVLAQRVMQQMAEEAVARERLKRQDEASQAQARLKEILSQEKQAGEQDAASRARLAAQQTADADALAKAMAEAPIDEARQAVVDELVAAGLLRSTDAGLLPTIQFMDRFAAIVYHDEMAMAGKGSDAGDFAEGEGHYVRGPLRSAIEVSHMDALASVVRARTRHPNVHHLVEDDIIVHREERETRTNIVLIVDRSGSMEENGRMEAAKRAALALHHAARQRDRRAQVRVFLMDTSVKAASLRDVWETEPTGFTNTGAALRLAREACARDGRTLVYLITDGLPEAFTRDGRDVAGHPDDAMTYAKIQAKRLADERGVAGFLMLLLEPEDELFVDAARTLAEVAGGSVVPVDPATLVSTLLQDFDRPPNAKAAHPAGAANAVGPSLSSRG